MKRKLVNLLLAAVLAISMIGCGSGGQTDAADKPAGAVNPEDTGMKETNAENTDNASAEVTGETAKEIDFYAAILKEEGCNAIAKAFEEKTGIKVNVHSYDSADFVQAFMVAANGGSPIDVMLLNGQDVRYYAKNGLIQDVSGLGAKDRLSEAAVEQYTLNGKLYGIGSKGGNSSGVYVNMDILDKYGVNPPETMQDMIDINNQLKADGLTFFAFGGGNKYMWPMWYFSAFAQTSGDPLGRTEEILMGNAKFTDADSIEAFAAIQMMAEEGMYQAGFNGTDSDGGKAIFLSEQSAAFYGGTWEITGFVEAGMNNLKLIPFPIIKDGAVSIQTGNASDGAYSIYSKIDPARQSAAELFIDFVTSDETIMSFRDSEVQDLRDYARVSCNKNVPMLENADALTQTQKEFLDTMTFTHPDWIYPPEITAALQDVLQALAGLQITPQEAGAKMQEAMDKLLAEGYDYNAVEQK